jgi:predicted transcriptional regulator
MIDMIQYLMKRTGDDVGRVVREALRDAADLERRIALDETHPALQRVISEEKQSFTLDPAMLEKLRYIVGRTGREPHRVLREALDAAYDLERQDHCDELDNAAFMHAINEEDPVDWEKARRAETERLDEFVPIMQP